GPAPLLFSQFDLRNTKQFSQRSSLLLTHQDRFLRRARRSVFGCNKSSGPNDILAVFQYGPAFAFPAADAPLVQQAFQFVRAAMPIRPHAVSGPQVAQNQRALQFFPVQGSRALPYSLALRGVPVNGPEAEDATNFLQRNSCFIVTQLHWIR